MGVRSVREGGPLPLMEELGRREFARLRACAVGGLRSDPRARSMTQGSLSMRRSLRIALVLNPFTLRQRSGDHASFLSRELISRGHAVRGFGAPPGALPRSGGSLLPGIGAFHPDVLLAYDGLSPAGSHSAAVARRSGASLFVVEQGFPHVGRPIERVLRSVGERLWGPRVRRTLDGVLALDDLAREQALNFGLAEEQVHAVPGGVAVEAFRPGLLSHLLERHGVSGHVILAAGSLVEGRGLLELVDAFASTLARAERWTLVLAGEGPLRPALEARANIKGVGAQVVVVERPRSEELPALVSAATLMVDADASGRGPRRTTLGGLAAGTPLITVPGARFPSLAAAGAGLVAADATASALATALRSAAADPVRRARWADEARRLGEQQLSWRAAGAQVEQLLLAERLPASSEAPSISLRSA